MPPSLALRSWRCTEKILWKPVFLRLTARAFCGASPVRRGAAGDDRREAAPSKGNASPRVYDRMPLEPLFDFGPRGLGAPLWPQNASNGGWPLFSPGCDSVRLGRAGDEIDAARSGRSATPMRSACPVRFSTDVRPTIRCGLSARM